MALLHAIIPERRFRLREHPRQFEIPYSTEELFGHVRNHYEKALFWGIWRLMETTDLFVITSKPRASDSEKEMEHIAAQIQSLVDEGDIVRARKIISDAPAGMSKALDQWRQALAEPVARETGVATGRDLRVDSLWLEENSDQYLGQWVALKDSELLGCNSSRSALRENLKRKGKLKGALLVKIEG